MSKPSQQPAHEVTWDGQEIARIVKRAPVDDPNELRATERALAGQYRVIHGTIEIPRDWAEWHDAHGKEILDEPKCATARMGDEVELGDEDAARMLDADVIERLDAKPSRVGQVWTPPPVIKNSLAELDSPRARRSVTP